MTGFGLDLGSATYKSNVDSIKKIADDHGLDFKAKKESGHVHLTFSKQKD